jgi:hypothetical protein
VETSFESWEDVVSVFTTHIAHYAETGGGENALIGLKTEGSISLQYAGRVVYELFQNALDRAENRVRVSFEDGVLVIANDGRAVSVRPPMNYTIQHPKGRSDFHALCTLHISNKTPEHDFGNKGIGFRSVFGVSDRCEMWSRCADGGWWGIELVAQRKPTEWEPCAIPALDALVRSLGASPRPSFHLPRPLRSSTLPHPDAAGLSTLVLLRVNAGKPQIQIAEEVSRLETTRFQFVGLRVPSLELSIRESTLTSEAGWPIIWQEKAPDLADLAKQAGHDVAAPTVAVAWAPPGVTEQGYFYNYLPTKMRLGSPLDVHGDFQVKADREGMALDTGNVVGRYNHALLLRAATGHVQALKNAAATSDCRADFWILAAYPEGAPEAWSLALQEALFPNRALEGWVEFAVHFFSEQRPEASYRDFWDASLKWLERLAGYGHWTQTWQGQAKALCDALAQQEVRVIPIDTDADQSAVALPSRQERGQRAQRRVFFWNSIDEQAPPSVPSSLLRAGRSVTGFDLGAFTKPAGIVRYEAVQILQDLRQLPNDPATRQTDPSLTRSEQGALLYLAWTLKPAEVPPHFAWRAFSDTELMRLMGRALATLHLPTVEGCWEPARQLSAEQVAITDLATLMGLQATVFSAFLHWLGVAPAGAVPMVERGQSGWVSPLEQPPPLQPAGRGVEIGKLAPLLRDISDPERVLKSLQGLEQDGKWSVARAAVATTPWLASELFRQPEGLSPLPSRIAPHDVILKNRDNRSVFFAVPKDMDQADTLKQLGALPDPVGEAACLNAPRIMAMLERRCPNPDTLSASLATRLAALVDALVSGMGLEHVSNMPVLLEQRGTLRWRFDEEEVFVARREERQELRRFFPSLALAAATYRKDLPEALHIGEVRLRKRVCGDERQVTPLAKRLVDKMTVALPVLCAAAERSRQVRVDVERVVRAWSRPLLQTDDAWVEIRVTGPSLPPREWRRNAHEDVFHIPGDHDDDPGEILFDTRRPEGPPLRHFGTALARLLVRNAALGALFSEVLAALSEDALEDYVERRHLAELRDEWKQQLNPLSGDQQSALLEHLRQFTDAPDAVLRRGRLGGEDLKTNSVGSHRALESALRKGLDEALVPHLPKVVVSSENELAWQSWFKKNSGALKAWLAHQVELQPKWTQDLRKHIRKHLDAVDFDSEAATTSWVQAQGLHIERISQELEAFAATFSPVLARPQPASLAGWSPGIGRHGNAFGGPEGKIDPRKILEENLARSAWGDAAEKALLDYVIRTTLGFLEGPRRKEATQILLSVFRPGTQTRARVAAAIEREDWVAALHIADLWSGAGYDILGLEEGDAEHLIPVRYECKGLPTRASSIRVFLSRRELAVARMVHKSGPGKWCLVGVEPSGISVDLTEWVQPLIDAEQSPLEALHALGLEPDGYRLVVRRT